MKFRIAISHGLKRDTKTSITRVEALSCEEARQMAFCFLTSLMVLHPNDGNWKIVETRQVGE